MTKLSSLQKRLTETNFPQSTIFDIHTLIDLSASLITGGDGCCGPLSDIMCVNNGCSNNGCATTRDDSNNTCFNSLCTVAPGSNGNCTDFQCK